MKNVKLLMSVACAMIAGVTVAQDFSAPQYAKWGETLEERKANLLANSYLGEEVRNRNYDRAAGYYQQLVKNCPTGSINIYINGAKIYKAKINQAKDKEQKRVYVDSLMQVYDQRIQSFPNAKSKGRDMGTKVVLDIKARDMITYLPEENQLVRDTFRAALDAAGDEAQADLVVAYFADLCDDFQNTDLVTADEVIAEYDRLTPYFAKHPEAVDEKAQFDSSFGKSGAASCENLEKLFSGRLAAEPDNVDLMAQAVSLMSRAQCKSDFYYNTAEKYYAAKPTAQGAMALADGFQAKGDYDRATKYLNEALAVEEDPAERQLLLVRIALVNIAANKMSDAAAAARQARDLNPEDGVPYFILAQCYASSAAACGGFSGKTAFWVAYDTMAKAVDLLPADDTTYRPHAQQMLGNYRANFPNSEELFFVELKPGTSYTVNCGMASGITTTVRAR